jgi:hypothetical protein
MFTDLIFTLVIRLIFSPLARNYQEHHGAAEDAFAVWVGPFHLELNQAFVLDHEDVVIGGQLPTPFGRLEVSWRLCRGQEQVRQPGLGFHWLPADRGRPHEQTAVLEEDFPF